jgi:hypothetical protein
LRDPLKELTTKEDSETLSSKSITSSPPKSISSSLSDNEDSFTSSILEPTAEVEIISLDLAVEFELSEEDIKLVFSRFGTVKSVALIKCNVAHVKMGSYKELNDAIQFLNFRQLKSNAKLAVKWVFEDAKEV